MKRLQSSKVGDIFRNGTYQGTWFIKYEKYILVVLFIIRVICCLTGCPKTTLNTVLRTCFNVPNSLCFFTCLLKRKLNVWVIRYLSTAMIWWPPTILIGGYIPVVVWNCIVRDLPYHRSVLCNLLVSVGGVQTELDMIDVSCYAPYISSEELCGH